MHVTTAIQMENRMINVFIKCCLFFQILIISGYLNAQDNSSALSGLPIQNIPVKYISADHVYLDGGKKRGLAEGDTLQIFENGSVVASLKVIYVADHSSSCEIISTQRAIMPGMMVQIKSNTRANALPKINKNQRTRIIFPKRNFQKNPTTISGYLSFQWYHFKDKRDERYTFNQPTIRLKLKAKKLWNDAYNFNIKLRSRYNKRNHFSRVVAEKEWRNRLYEVSFAYENRESLINYKLGRIISNTFSGMGYIDGLLIRHNATAFFNWGLFAGAQPEWQSSGFHSSLQKYGIYLNYINGDYDSARFESTIAASGIYHGSTVSREFLYLQNSYNHKQVWNIYQSLELDINRDWRKEKMNQSVSISGLYLIGRYNINKRLSLGLSYDNRRNYYTYELRSLADSLFDDAFRQGVRIRTNLRLFKTVRLFANAGMRKTDARHSLTYSYTGGVHIMNILNKRLSASLKFSGYSNMYNQGINPSITISKYLSGGHSVRINYGNYLYRLNSEDNERLNQWMRFGAQIELPLHLFISSSYEYDWGDDRNGHHLYTELGYRF